MNKTSIEWVKNPDGSQGYTWNPITGCLNGCEYCYARKLANGRLKQRYLSNKNIATGSFQAPHGRPTEPFKDPFYPREWLGRRERLLESEKPKGVFVCDMSDLFGIGVPESWTAGVIETIKVCPEHCFYLLTKQPQNLAKWSPFPDNCWVGVTATNRDMFQDAIWCLLRIQAKVKYLSLEPLLSHLNAGILDRSQGHDWPVMHGSILSNVINWIIIGAQSRPKKMPDWGWVRDIINAADVAGIPIFLKNNLGLLKYSCEGAMPFYKKAAGTMELRQELPRMGVMV